MSLHGLERVVRNLNNELAKIKEGTLRGLIRAAIVIRRDMDFTSPLIPVDVGNLRASFFTVTSRGDTTDGSSPKFSVGPGLSGEIKSEAEIARLRSEHSKVLSLCSSKAKGTNPTVILGFSAYYAIYVHEKIGANFRRPGAGPKFLQASLYRNTGKVIDIVKREAKV